MAESYNKYKQQKESQGEKVPGKEELVTMSRKELNELIQGVKDEFAEEIKEAKAGNEKLQKVLEQNSVVDDIKHRGATAESRIKVHGSNQPYVNLKPIDKQAEMVKEHKDKLKGKVPRFVNNDPDLRSLRRYQGYEPVRDDDGNEVRYVDGVLMGIPIERYNEEIAKPREAKKNIARSGIADQFRESVERYSGGSVEATGDISYDEGGS